MKKKLFLMFLFCFTLAGVGFSQESNPPAVEQNIDQIIIKGEVEEVASDGSYIIVDSNKIFVSENFLEESYLETGDPVEITAKETDKGIELLSYRYIFDDDNAAALEEDAL